MTIFEAITLPKDGGGGSDIGGSLGSAGGDSADDTLESAVVLSASRRIARCIAFERGSIFP